MWRGCCVLISRGGWEKRAGLGRRSHLELKRGLHHRQKGVRLLSVERCRQGDDEWKCDEQKAQHDLEALGFGVLRLQDEVCVGRRAGGWRAMSRATSIAGVRPLGGHARVRAPTAHSLMVSDLFYHGSWYDPVSRILLGTQVKSSQVKSSQVIQNGGRLSASFGAHRWRERSGGQISAQPAPLDSPESGHHPHLLDLDLCSSPRASISSLFWKSTV